MMLAVPTKYIALQYARVQLAGKSIFSAQILINLKYMLVLKVHEIIEEAVVEFNMCSDFENWRTIETAFDF